MIAVMWLAVVNFAAKHLKKWAKTAVFMGSPIRLWKSYAKPDQPILVTLN